MNKLDSKNIENILALTPLQEGMLFHYLQDPQSQLYFEQLSLAISGEIDLFHFEKAWDTVIKWNEMLRTLFRWEKLEKPSQVILKVHHCGVIFYDLSGIEVSRKETVLNKIKDKARRKAFDLHQVPFGVILCKLAEDEYQLIISNHHILYDGWSNGIILEEFFNVYHQLSRGVQSTKLPEKPSFKEFIKWIHDQDRSKQEKFWSEYFAGFETAAELSIKRRTKETPKHENYSFVLEQDLHNKLDSFVKDIRVTLAAVFYTAWGILLQKYCGSDDTVFGTTVSGRSAGIKGIENMVGLFINTIPLRFQTTPGEKLKTTVFRVDRELREREEFEHTPLTDIRSYSRISGGESLFDTIVAIENYPLDNRLLPTDSMLSVQSYSIVEMTHYDLSVGVRLFSEIEINFSYKMELFEKETVENLAGHYKGILQNIIEKPDTVLSQLEIITIEEKNRLLYEFNNTAAEYPADKTIHQLFMEQAERTPDRVGLVGVVGPVRHVGQVGLSYRKLNEQSNLLAGLLIEKGVLPDTIVAIMMGRSVEMIMGILGILKSGGAYLPIDPDYPQERIEYMLKESNAKILLLNSDLNSLNGRPRQGLHHSSFINHHSNQLAYIIYTSGSTGQPKGVMVEHRNVVNTVTWFAEQYKIGVGVRVLQMTDYTFDPSVEQIFGTLLHGGTLYLADEELLVDIDRLRWFIEWNQLHIINSVPMMMKELLVNGPKLKSLRAVLSGGDKLDEALKDILLEKGYELYNHYGPTEVTVDALTAKCTNGPVVLGKPIANVECYILGGHGELMPVEVAGELIIGGRGVARGYLNKPELTADRFNFNRSYGTNRTYIYFKTGDLCRWLPCGNIEFLGRIDQQVKIRGFRIELGEIENCLLKHAQINDAIVVAREDAAADKYLAAYYVSDHEISEAELRGFLAKDLPGYMLPSYFMRLGKLPLTPSGKVDRMGLPAPTIKELARYVAPRNEIEMKLAEIWCGILGGNMGPDRLGIDENFFRLGGHSLKVTSLASQIYKEFNVKISVSEIFKNPTIRGLFDYISGTVGEQYIQIEPVEEKEYYQLSSAQKRLYFLQQMDFTGTAYNISAAWVLEGILNTSLLEATFVRLIKRHESFRTSFHIIGGQPVQRIHDEVVFELKVFAELFSKSDPPEASLGGGSLLKFIQPFDLSQAPLLRVGLKELDKERYLLLVDIHHIVADGISTEIIARELTTCYRGEELPPLSLRYRDYTEWQNRLKKEENFLRQQEYWEEEFAGEIPVLELPTDYARPAVQSFEGNRISFTIKREISASLNSLALETGTTLYIVLLALYSIFLAKLSSREDIVIGSPAAGRRRADFEKIIGMFVNTLALRSYPSAEKGFMDFLDEVKVNALNAFENQEYQYEDLVEHISINRDVGRNPFFDAMFVLQNTGSQNIEIPGLKLISYENENNTSKFDLTLTAVEIEGKLELAFEYCTKLFKATTIERFIAYFKNIVTRVVADRYARIVELEIMPEEERNRLLYEFNNTAAEYPADKSIHQLFVEQAEKLSDHVGVVGPVRHVGQVGLSYRKLNEQTDQLAGNLIEKGVLPDTIVAIMMDRSVEMIIGVFGILKAGGAYLPVDPGFPRERIDYILKDSGTKVLVNEKFFRGCGGAVFQKSPPAGSTLAYIIYTSGSTGSPKGVMIEHGSLTNRLNWMQKTYPLDMQDTILQKTPFTFDVSVWEIFWWSMTGASLCLLVPGGEKDPELIIKAVDKNHITTLHFVPSMLSVFLDYLKASGQVKKLSGLKHVIASGEALLPAHVERFNELLYKENGTVLSNLYGPTEATIDVTYFDCFPGKENEIIPIGKPIDNINLYILDRSFLHQPVGVVGELYIAGVGLARGYLNQSELTAERFIIKYRSNSSSKTDIIYKTGDLARWLNDGNIEFLGRIDHQVKIRGFRIELGEIENRILNYPGIKEVVVLVHEQGSGDKCLCAYIISEKKYDAVLIREFLLNGLPDYMIPTYFETLEKIPLTPNGKVDRKALTKPELKTREGYTAPRNEIEKKLVELWTEILGQSSFGIDDNFFQLGGHSLKAMILVSKIHEEFDVRVPLAEIFKTSRIRELATYIKEKNKEFHISIEPAEEKEYYELSPAQKRLYFLQQLGTDNIGYNMPFILPLEGTVEKEKLEPVFKRLIARHESLRTSFITPNDEPFQRIHREVDFSIGYYEIKETTEIVPLISTFIKPFKLNEGPLLRVNLIVVGLSRWLLFIDMHHIITDGTSLDILQKEFMDLYSEPGKVLPLLKLQYKDFSEWENSRRQKESIRRQESYWVQEFTGEIPAHGLPTDYPRPLTQSFVGDRVQFTLDQRETNTLKIISKENDLTLYMVLLTVFNILFSKLSGQEDIIVGTPIAARRHIDLQPIVGMLVNTLPMRNFPASDKSFSVFLEEVRQRTLAAYENQEYPFEYLVNKVSVRRDTSRNPIFDIMFALQNQVEEQRSREISEQTSIHKVSRFDLGFNAVESNDRIEFTLEYCSKLFKPATIETFIKYYKKIILELENNREQKLAEIEIIPEEEKEQILRISNGVDESGYRAKQLHRWFEQQAEKSPDLVAVTGTGIEHISFGQLNKEANRLANLLRKKGAGKGCVVALMMERSIKMITAIIAILKAGSAYLPIDPQLPGQRINIMLNDSRASLLITSKWVLEQFSFSITALKNLETDSNNFVLTPPRAQITELERLPVIDRTLVDYEKYHRYVGIARAKNTISLQATRGCPYNCLYCHKIWPKKHIMRSADHIFEEVRICFEAGVKRFSFVDDIFNLHEKNSGEFLRKIIRHGFDVQLYFPNGLRGDILTKAFIDLMIEAGTIEICLALETASPRLQKRLGKNLNLEKFQENVHYITSTYPHVVLDLELMIGFPTETEEEALQTLEMLKSFKWIHFPDLNILKIYPNTDMYRFAIENGVSKESIEKSTNLAYQELPETLPFSKSFTRQYQARYMKEYFLLKERLLSVLPVQMATATEDELVQKYDSYLPLEIKNISDILHFAAISKEELGGVELRPADYMTAPDFNEKIRKFFPVHEKKNNAYKVLLLDLSVLFSKDSNMFYDMIEEPLGLMALLTYLDKIFQDNVRGKIAKSRIDFDSFEELKALISDFKPDMIGIRTLSYYKEFFHRTVLLIRQWGFKGIIAAGGPYATSDYKLLLQDENIDLVVLGEGELTFAELIDKVLVNCHQLPDEEILSRIPGIVFLKGKNRAKGLTPQKSREILLLDEPNIRGELDKYPAENLEIVGPSDDLLYVIYTSGSTGIPKGVMLEQQNMANLIYYQYKHTNIDFSRVLQFTTISFDVSAQEIFSTLLAGGQLFLIDRNTLNDIPGLFKIIEKNNIQTLFLPASFLKFVSGEENYIKLLPLCIKHIITAGEQPIIYESFKKFLQSNNVYFHNHYGPSETHVVTALSLDPEGEIPALPAIGRPVANTGIYLLDKGLHVTPVGVAGELFIWGNQVGRGYLNNPELTAEKFIKYRSNRSYKTYINYKTGDLARWLSNGNIEYLGRIDQQIKIRGFRVELGEIENRLANYPGIKDALILAGDGESGDKYLYAYYVSGEEFGSSELRDYLAKKLPDYMIPSHFMRLEKIPLTPNGKVDRGALPKPGLKVSESYAAPGDDIERRLVSIWSEVLGFEKEVIGIDTDFFQLGGHSLKATLLTSRMHKEFNVKIPLAEIFKKPNIRELSAYIKETAAHTHLSIEKVEEKEYYELSSAQKRLYVLQQMNPTSTVYNVTFGLVLMGELELVRLEEIMVQLISRHESMRTSIIQVNNEPFQKVWPVPVFKIEYFEVSGREGLDSSHSIRIIAANFIRSFDLAQAPLVRVGIIKEKEKPYMLMVDMHHIITDGTSMKVLLTEIETLLVGEKLPPLKLQYKDYSEWQRSEMQKETARKQEKYWLNRFGDDIPVLDLPTDYIRPAVQDFEGNAVHFELSKEQYRELNILAANMGVTLYILLLAIYTILLAKLSGQEDIIVGTPIAARRHVDLEGIIGMFVNTLALRNYPAGEVVFKDYLREVKEATLEAFENQEYPFETLVDKVNIIKNAARNPLFDVMFMLHNFYDASGIGSISREQIEGLEQKIAKFDLTLAANEENEILHFSMEYCTRLLKEENILRFIQYFKSILSAVIKDPGQRLAEIDILATEEKDRLLNQFNNTEAAYPDDKTIHQLFEARATKTPDRVGVVGQVRLSYRKLNEQADQLAGLLIEKGVLPDSLVAIKMERCIEMIISILGILKSGGAYLPLNPKNPEERINYMLKDSNAKILISKSENRNPKLETNSNIQIINDQNKNRISIKGCLHRGPSNLAYVIYTSGSTGNPKGVAITHANLCPLLHWGYQQLGIGLKDRVLQNLSYYFDWSAWEIFITITSGARLYMVSDELLLNPFASIPFMKANDITILHVTPTQYLHFIGGGAKLETLKYLFLGAEKLTVDLLKRSFASVQEDCRVFNMYGPTEAAIISSVLEINRGDEMPFEGLSSVPIGRSMANGLLLVMDRYLKPCPVNVPGELFIGGGGVARGYLNNPELTAERFIQYRSNRSYKTYIIYKTGDLTRWLSNGNIEFLGRIDDQVKLRGFRVELGEIENRLLKHPGIKEAVVLLHEEAKGDKYICAYAVSADENVTVGLREFLTKELPDYMIPAHFVRLEKVPLTPNGKIDRRALPKPEIKIGETYTAPRNDVENKLEELWSEVLGLEKEVIGIDSDFFQLGGHSLKATSLIAKIHKLFGVKVPLAELFKTPRIRELAGYINAAASREYKQIELAEKKEYYTLSSAQKRLYLLQQMDKDSTAYNIPLVLRLVGIVDKNKLEQSIRGLIRRHESLRTSFIIVNEDPVQRISNEVEFEIEYLATDGLGQTRTFDLSKAPLLRVGLGIIEEEKHLFRVDMHHIISDGVSSRVLVQDFSTLYAGEEAPEIKLQYKDYAEWQNRERVSNNIQQQGEYWEKEFFGEIPVLELPADVARPPVQAFEGSSIIFKIEKEICEGLKTLAQEAGATLYIVLLMLYNIFLAKLCSREDIVIGSPVAGRKHADLEKIIGMFVNTLALRNYPSGEKRVIDFLGEVKERTLEALENQEYQYEDLVEKVTVTRDVSRNPLFDTMFALQNFKLEKMVIPGLKLIPFEVENTTSKFDLTLTGIEIEGGLEFTFEYSTKLFKRTTIERFIIYFKNIIAGVLQDSGIRISEVEILALEEKNFILFQLNESEKEYPKDKTIHQLFMEQVSKTPDCVGLVGVVGLSYRKLNEQTDQLAGSLLETGILPDYIVGIIMERSLEQIIGILSILKAGGAYLPIDLELPQDRIEYMLKDSGAKLLVNEKFFREARALRRGEPIGVLQKCPPGIANLAYVIYTSGSTGKPKGVMVEHRSLVNLCWWHKMFYSITSRDRTTRYAGFGFDASVWEIFPYLISGASLYIVPEQLILDIRALNVYYEKNDITIGFLPTQVCEQFMAFDNKSLRVLLTGGDKLRNYIQRSYRLYNNYGPTENTVVTTSFCVTGEFANIPIGKPVFNNQIYIVDRYQRLQPIGVPGEILVGGDGLARGYLNNPELTAEKFIKYRSYRTNRTYINYKTGDLARWLDSGNIEFLGRIDLQVKIRGFRIELGEIESRLSKYPGIKEALVLVQEEVSGDKYLCGYVVSDREYKISELREFLSKELPDYMIPSHWMQLEKIPLTPNGKVDRKTLPKLELKTGEVYTAPRNTIERKLVELWAEILGHASIGIDDNFFQLGGHSLKAAILAAKIHKVFDVKVPLAEIFKTPRINELAKFIKDKSRQLYTGIEPVEKMEYYALSSAQMRLYVQQKMNPDSTAYNMPVIIPLPVGADWRKIEEAFKKLIKRHEILRTSFHMVNDTPVQKVNEHVEFEIEYLTTDEYGQTRTFDLSKAPLLRVALWKMEQELILMVDMHHIISDGASMEIVIDDFIRFYQGENLTALNVQYKDYAAWQDKRLTEETLQSQEKYWLNQLQDFVFTRFPYDYLDSHDLIKGATLYEEIGTALYDKIERFCNEHQVTRFVFLITVFELALARNIDQWDITLGIPSSIRDHPDLKDLIGIFLNVLLIRTVIDYTEPFINCLARNKDTVIDALNNQDYPYEMLNDKMRAVSPSKENELFSILFNYFPLNPDKKSATTDFEIKPMETRGISPKYDMTLYVSDGNGRIMLSMVYKSNIYNKDSIGRLLSDFLEMLQRVLADSNIPISQLTTWDGDNGEELELDREIETYYNEGEF